MVKILSFAPNKLTQIYLRRLAVDFGTSKPSPMLNKIVSELFLLKYGKDARNEAREEYMELIFKDYWWSW